MKTNKNLSRIRELAQWVKAVAATPDDPETYMVKKQTNSQTLSSDLHDLARGHTHSDKQCKEKTLSGAGEMDQQIRKNVVTS